MCKNEMKISKKKIAFIFLIFSIILLTIGGIICFYKNDSKKNIIKKNPSESELEYEKILKFSKTLEESKSSNVKIDKSSNGYIIRFTDKNTEKLNGIYIYDEKNKKIYKLPDLGDSMSSESGS